MTVRGTGGPISMFMDWPVNESEHLRIHRDGRPVSRTQLAVDTRRENRTERFWAGLCCRVTIGHCWHRSARIAVSPAPSWFCCECPADRWSAVPAAQECKVCVQPGIGVAP